MPQEERSNAPSLGLVQLTQGMLLDKCEMQARLGVEDLGQLRARGLRELQAEALRQAPGLGEDRPDLLLCTQAPPQPRIPPLGALDRRRLPRRAEDLRARREQPCLAVVEWKSGTEALWRGCSSAVTVPWLELAQHKGFACGLIV